MRMPQRFILVIILFIAGALPAVEGTALQGAAVAGPPAAVDAMGQHKVMQCCVTHDEGLPDRASSCVTDCHYLPSIHIACFPSSVSPYAPGPRSSPHDPVMAGLFRPPIRL